MEWLWLKVAIVGYLLGSIPFGYLISKLYKIDIRNHGSGNIGFTNVMRVIGIKPAAFVLILDAAKGYISARYGFVIGGEALVVVGALAAMAGHSWPLLLKFKGGRGVATGLGIIIFLSFKITLFALVVWLIVVYLTRYVSLGSIIAAFFVPIGMFLVNKPLSYLLFSIIGASLVILRHRSNIERLLKGNENKIKFSATNNREEKHEKSNHSRGW